MEIFAIKSNFQYVLAIPVRVHLTEFIAISLWFENIAAATYSPPFSKYNPLARGIPCRPFTVQIVVKVP
jgi:hypothetical protein